MRQSMVSEVTWHTYRKGGRRVLTECWLAKVSYFQRTASWGCLLSVGWQKAATFRALPVEVLRLKKCGNTIIVDSIEAKKNKCLKLMSSLVVQTDLLTMLHYVILMFFTWPLIPGHLAFLCATMKSWTWCMRLVYNHCSNKIIICVSYSREWEDIPPTSPLPMRLVSINSCVSITIHIFGH